MAKPRHRQPTFAQSLAPTEDKRPRAAPGSDRDRTPAWLLGLMDFGGPWCWRRMDLATLQRVRERLAAFEGMAFKEIVGKKNHEIPVEQLGSEAQYRLLELGIDEYDAVLSLGVTSAERVWGLKAPHGVYLLWWDPQHSVYPMNIANN